eukprot:g2038.t1
MKGQVACAGKCSQGRYGNLVGQASSDYCKMCPRGQYQDVTGQKDCKRCESIQFAKNKGSVRCQDCPGIVTVGNYSIDGRGNRRKPCYNHGECDQRTGECECDVGSGWISGEGQNCKECNARDWDISDVTCSVCVKNYEKYILGGKTKCLPKCPDGQRRTLAKDNPDHLVCPLSMKSMMTGVGISFQTTCSNDTVHSLDMQKCVPCSFSIAIYIVFAAVSTVILILCLRKFINLSNKYPGAIGGSAASIGIIIAHAQMMVIIVGMDLHWPNEVKHVRRYLHIFDLDLPEALHAECLLKGNKNATITAIWCAVAVSVANVCCILACGQKRARYFCNMRTDLRDIIICGLVWKFFREVCLLLRIREVYCLCFEPKCLQSIWQNDPFGKNRLERRLNYFVKRFADNAPFWQFVIWMRQVFILIVRTYINNIYVKGVSIVIICTLSIIFHVKVKPFKYKFQNMVETWLLGANIVIISAAIMYSTVLKPKIEEEKTITAWIVSIMILISMFGSFIFAIVHLRLWVSLKIAFMEMKENVSINNRKNSQIELRKTLLEEDFPNVQGFDDIEN